MELNAGELIMKETFIELKKQAKNLLLYGSKHCEYLDFIIHPWDGDYAVCKIWYKNKIEVDERDFIYMDDDVCYCFKKADEKEVIRRKKEDGSWELERE
jgi:hypothetical protein